MLSLQYELNSAMNLSDSELDKLAVRNFKEYVRIPSVHPDVNYDECVAFLRRQAAELDLPIQVHELATDKPIVIITWLGEEPALPSIMLNSHMDVVPVCEEYWTYPPFGAEQDEQGNIFGRGTQDTKGVGIQYLEAVRRLTASGIRLRRTVHISYMPDEETGGKLGMEKFIDSQEFRDLNIGFAFDEGLPHPDDIIQIVHGERTIWQVTFHCSGAAGPSELPKTGTAGEKVRVILDRAMEFRQTQKEKLKSDPTLTTGDVTSLNLTMMKGGAGSAGDVPEQLSVTFDVRVAVTDDHEEMEAKLHAWCEEVGPGSYCKFQQKKPRVEPTRLDDDNPWWLAFKAACEALGLTTQPVVGPAVGDGLHLRTAGVPTLGFAPMCNTPGRMHDNDEFLNEQVFLRGIRIYCHLLQAMANLVP